MTTLAHEIISHYLDSQGCTLWGRAFDIKSDDGREQAITFIQSVIDGLDLSSAEVIRSHEGPIRYA